MGICISGEEIGCDGENQKNSYTRNQDIDRQLRRLKQGDDEKKEIKLLLLGTGDSGKSTFAKQMKVIHKSGFAHTELVSFKNILKSNTLSSMQKLLDYAETKNVTFSDAVQKRAKFILEAGELNMAVASEIEVVWRDKQLKDFMFKHVNDMQIPTTSDYYFDNVLRFGEEDFRPTNDDIFRCKLKTTGINETKFTISDIEFTLVDVGGQRSERKKWLHCFDGVRCVIFITALDEYNMTLQEDNTTPRLEESLKLFREVTQKFEGKSIILFLNKSDIFRDKIKQYPLTDYFKDCPEDVNNYKGALKYISKKYEDEFKGPGKLYIYESNALDTDNCRNVFDAVRDQVVSNSLKYAGFF